MIIFNIWTCLNRNNRKQIEHVHFVISTNKLEGRKLPCKLMKTNHEESVFVRAVYAIIGA